MDHELKRLYHQEVSRATVTKSGREDSNLRHPAPKISVPRSRSPTKLSKQWQSVKFLKRRQSSPSKFRAEFSMSGVH